ncbi:MAG: PDZ domain-containing protein, partial [Sphingomonas sp.]
VRPSALPLVGGGDDGFSADDDDNSGSGAVAPTSGNALGLTVQPLTPAIARAPAVNVDATVQGVVIAQVDPSSDAAGKLKRGDVIVAVNGAQVRSAADVAAAVTAAKAAGRPQVLLLVQRARGPGAFVPVKIKG